MRYFARYNSARTLAATINFAKKTCGILCSESSALENLLYQYKNFSSIFFRKIFASPPEIFAFFHKIFAKQNNVKFREKKVNIFASERNTKFSRQMQNFRKAICLFAGNPT